METVYAVAMVLGFKKALERSYELFISPLGGGPSAALPHYALLIALLAVMLLGSRFFWVPRNLHAFAYETPWRPKSRPRRLTMYHFPITLIHAVLFYCVCQAWVELVESGAHAASGTAHHLVVTFIRLFAGLLLLNGLWLLATFRFGLAKPETRWGIANLVFAAVAFGGAACSSSLFHNSNGILLLAAGILFIVNGLVDVALSPEAYTVYPAPPSTGPSSGGAVT